MNDNFQLKFQKGDLVEYDGYDGIIGGKIKDVEIRYILENERGQEIGGVYLQKRLQKINRLMGGKSKRTKTRRANRK
jgi:hypothetical protein